jgi:hypothetical protein
MPPARFEPTLWADEQLHIHALDRTATGTRAEKTDKRKIQYVYYDRVTITCKIQIEVILLLEILLTPTYCRQKLKDNLKRCMENRAVMSNMFT